MNELNPYMKNSIPTKFWKNNSSYKLYALQMRILPLSITTPNNTSSFVHFATQKDWHKAKYFFLQLVSLHLNSQAIKGVF